MINDPTELHFEFDDRPSEVRPRDVSRLVEALENLFAVAARVEGLGRATFLHVAGASRGSIRFSFRVDFEATSSSAERGASVTSSGLGLASNIAGIAGGIAGVSSLFAALFLPNGVYDLLANGGTKNEDDPVYISASEIVTSPFGDDIRKQIKSIQDVARESGADRVFIQLPGESRVLITSRVLEQHPFSGRWLMKIHSPMGDQEIVMDAIVSDGEFRGNTKGAMGEHQIGGRVDGKSVYWQVSISEPMPMTLEFSGIVLEESFAGQVKLGKFGSATMTGVRIREGQGA